VRVLLVFTRYPEPGLAKTRLVPLLGAAGAAALHRAMAEHTLRAVRGTADRVEVRYAGGDDERMRAWLGPGVELGPQGPGDLATRLGRGFAEAFRGGADSVAAVGTDCPDMGSGDVRSAFAALGESDVVFGPAADGGYWLVGLSRGAWERGGRAVFAGIPWGTGGVLSASRSRAAGAGLGVRLLRELQDVDRPADLPAWERASRRGDPPPTLSVVVPALDEEERIAGLVAGLAREPGVEVVVADGGSGDATAAAAAALGGRVVTARRGRACQMNAGAAAAAGEALLFLHADTALPRGFAPLVLGALGGEGVAGGAFSFATDSPRRSLRAIERLANWRARRLGIVFGDQAIFTSRRDFEAVGGFPELPVMEDRELVRRLRRRGRFLVLAARAVTSARRWHERGVWRTSGTNLAITWAHEAGVPAATLARWRG